MLRRVLRLLLLVGLASCDAGEETRLAHRSLPIVNGVLDRSVHAVGTLPGCTATLAGRRLALTAAHCVKTGERVAVTFEGWQGLAHAERHPAYDFRALTYDLALLRLLEPAPASIEPLALAFVVPAAGQTVTLLGHGITAEDRTDGALRRRATSRVAAVSPLRFVLGGDAPGLGQSCYGDSGGPVLDEGGDVIGLVSGSLPPCGRSTDVTRLDAAEAWLREAGAGELLLANAAGCAVAGSSRPPSPSTSFLVGIGLLARAACGALRRRARRSTLPVAGRAPRGRRRSGPAAPRRWRGPPCAPPRPPSRRAA